MTTPRLVQWNGTNLARVPLIMTKSTTYYLTLVKNVGEELLPGFLDFLLERDADVANLCVQWVEGWVEVTRKIAPAHAQIDSRSISWKNG